MAFVLDNAVLWVGDGSSHAGHVVVEGSTIQAVGRGRYHGPLPTIDLAGAFLSPGMVDLMVLGGFDRSIMRDDASDIAREYLRLGVTRCQFCTGTLPWEGTQRVVANVRQARANASPDKAGVIGLYLEGPFMKPELSGASLAINALPATAHNVDRILELASDVLTMINVSPGIDGDIEAIRRFSDAGVIVSMAHADAGPERVLACVEAGTTVLGHCWNNNHAPAAEPGVRLATIEHVALTDERVRAVHMICDGTHVDPILVRLVHRCRGIQGIVLVTDCVPRAGCADGPYTWDDGRLFQKIGGVGRTDRGGLTGSALLLPDHWRNYIQFTGITPAEAMRLVTYNPAQSINMLDKFGVLAPGRFADLAVWDAQLRLQRVWREGIELQNVSPYAERVA